MCGIFGQVSKQKINKNNLCKLAKYAKRRGYDSSGLIFYDGLQYKIVKADYDIEKLLKKVKPYNCNLALGHSRLVTNGLYDNQPVIRGNICVIHNGIIVNEKDVWEKLNLKRMFHVDSEVIAAIAEEHLQNNGKIEDIPSKIFNTCEGTIASALLLPEHGKLLLFSNNGSLYAGNIDDDVYFSSEKYILTQINCKNINQIKKKALILDIDISNSLKIEMDEKSRTENLIPKFNYNNKNEKSLLEFQKPNIKRCTKCVLPETMPFIEFDEQGICNYCCNYKIKNNPKPKEELFALLEPYRKAGNTPDCIVPFSGGRDSCYGLHFIVNELKMKPITYTYDWGMVTDLGRRNISRMCASLGVENIIIAADISKKRKNIKMNLQAWLKSPHLGMMAMLTAGDKHFFRYIQDIKNETGINLNLWGINPLEVTHFKTGFLDISPDFDGKKVYSNGMFKQLNYHKKRFKAMLQNPKYFNSSLWDTLSGEYYRSIKRKDNYFHIFDYWRWDEKIINDILINQYDWETAVDTTTTWRIGDGTAAFYNYVYYTVAGFTEHDTFRSNQIREGQISREKALELLKNENKPRYQNIKWYLDVLGMDFSEVIKVVNSIPKLYRRTG
jgi:hypothetical protein